MNVKIQITAGEILNHGNWDAFCDLHGYNVYAINEGLMDSSEVFTLTLKEACQVGLRHTIIDGLERAEADLSLDSSTCGTCHETEAQNTHSCPYQVAIKANPDSEYCDCCEDCTTQCQMYV